MPLKIPSGATVTTIMPTTLGSGKWWTKFANASAPLFASGTPEAGDVAQGKIANCFALASILAIVLRRAVAGSGHSGGEPVAKGLVGSHSYAVKSTWVNGKLRGLWVINPWGFHVRDYALAGHNLSSTQSDNLNGNGLFPLLLEDYVKRFTRATAVALNLA